MLSRIFHWGPLLALGIIKCITLTTLNVLSTWFEIFSVLGILNYSLFLTLVGTTLYHFFSAVFVGPGHVPKHWAPENKEKCVYLQYCKLCEGYKAPRAHHCRKCNRCVMKMDHHCPWINNCCGHKNHGHFTLFLISAVFGSLQAALSLAVGLFRAFNHRYYIHYFSSKNQTYLTVYQLIFMVFSLGLSIGVVLALGGLFFVQIRAVLKNETNIENWIVTKANSRSRPDGDVFIYPYNLGRWKNFKAVFMSNIGDGITWPILPGCHQYTLTHEQIQQKVEKQARSRKYYIVEAYSGSIFPISKGFRVCCCPPCSEESRIPVYPHQEVLVSRWKRHWLYGEIAPTKKGEPPGPKGWFPRLCAAECTSLDCDLRRISKKLK